MSLTPTRSYGMGARVKNRHKGLVGVSQHVVEAVNRTRGLFANATVGVNKENY